MSSQTPSHLTGLHPGLPTLYWSVIFIALLCVSGCTPNSPPTPSNSDTSTTKNVVTEEFTTTIVSQGINTSPFFIGPQSVIAADQKIHLYWKPAQDDHTPAEKISYRIYLATRTGKQDFEKPAAITAPGMTSHTIENLPNGDPVYVVVRAFDEQGKGEENESEWPALPNPVLYVNGNAKPGGDGTDPKQPLRSIDNAIGEAIGLAGVNIHVAEGLYREQLLLFQGMGIYGGFAADFTGPSNPEIHPTELLGRSKKDTLILPPGHRLVVIDGFSFDGFGEARRAIVADDCQIRISRCQIQSFLDKGIQVETDRDDEGVSSGVVQGCVIQNNGGDGIRIEGFVDLALRDCVLTDNGQSGISVSPLVPHHGEKTRIEIEPCAISNNNDVGLSIRIDDPLGNTGSPARIRIGLRGVLASGNNDHGSSFDIRYPEDSNIDLRIRIEQSSFIENSRSGIHIDADAPGDFSITDSAFLGNLGEGAVLLTGDSDSALTRIQSCLFASQANYGIHLKDSGLLDVSRSLFFDNQGPAVFTTDEKLLRSRAWASIGSGPVPEGIRLENSDFRPATSQTPVRFLRINENSADGISVAVSENRSLPETGFIFPALFGPGISFQSSAGNQLLLASKDAPAVQKNSVWLLSSSAKRPVWKEFISIDHSSNLDVLELPTETMRSFPGISRISFPTHRPLDVVAISPNPGLLLSGQSLRWDYQLTEALSRPPEVHLTINGTKSPVKTEVSGESLKVMSLVDLPKGSRIRIEWAAPLEPGDSLPQKISHEWVIADEVAN
ncbi:MAG: right-handed parallel beta-helix repeat-containing protein [Planctomycetota bacterium]